MTQTQVIRKLVHALAVCVAVTACGGGGGDAGMPSTIGPAGGTVASAEGASVTIPAGALAAQVAIAVAKDAAGAPALPQGVQLAGDIFAITPHGTTFALRAALSVPFDPARVPMGATLALMKTNAALTGWAPVPGATVNGSKMNGSISSFSFVVVVAALAPTITQGPADQTVAVAQSATFSVVASGNPSPTPLLYAWQSSTDGGTTWTAIAGATNASYTTPAATPGDAGTRFRVNVELQAVPFINVDSASATLTVVAAGPAIPMVAAGAFHSVALKADGTVWAWGRNDQGQLGGLAAANSPTPVQVAGLVSIRKLAAGRYHSLALAADGGVWAWGQPAASGIVGPLLAPIRVALTGRFTDIAAGDGFSVALRDDGSVWAWGMNTRGELGRGTQGPGTDDPTTPLQVIGVANITSISAGGNHTLALKNDQTVWAWGNNVSGQIGDGSVVTSRPVPVAVATLAGVVAIRAVNQMSFALTFDGLRYALYSWGSGFKLVGQMDSLGSSTPMAVVALQPYAVLPSSSYVIGNAIGTSSTVFLLAIDSANGNAVDGAGANADGELGNGTTVDAATPTAAAGLADVRSVDASHVLQLHAFAIARKGDGTVWSWGYNGDGQLGDGTTTSRLVPVQVQGLNLN